MQEKSSLSSRSSDESQRTSEDNGDPCGFCGVSYLDMKFLSKGDWIRCDSCKVWYHEVFVGAAGRKQFTCGKCV